MARPRTDPGLIDRALAEWRRRGGELVEVAREFGVSKSVLYDAARERDATAARGGGSNGRAAARTGTRAHKDQSPRKSPSRATTAVDSSVTTNAPMGAVEVSSDPIDAEGDPIAVARGLLASLTDSIAKLDANSPRLNGARAEARQVTKLIAALEKDRAKVETAEERERRLRREDAETRHRIEEHLVKYEREAAERGVCLWCGHPTSAT